MDPAEPTRTPLAPMTRTRIDAWKERLLDLSLRNRLIHFTPSKVKSVALAVSELDVLEDRLVKSRGVTLVSALPPLPVPPDSAASPPDSAARVREQLEKGRVPTAHPDDDLKARLLAIHRQARTELDESGASTLYLALGVLRWFESDAASVERRAPILLYPVELLRRGPGLRFELRLRDDEPRVNDTLLEKLRIEFDLDFAALRELPRDDAGIDVKAVLAALASAVARFPRFEVQHAAFLAFFSFAKFLLWRDLDEHTDDVLENDLVRHLVLGDRGDRFPAGGFLDPRRLDELRPASLARLALDADSSQHVAVDAAIHGRSFVLQGPPGTGKSQTIANIISECLAAGKRVLFVAEKRAALEVVAKRLAAVGLADACLELHSNKASKKEVVVELARTLDTDMPRMPADRTAVAEQVESGALRLDDYAERLHAETPLGMSHFQCLGRKLALADAPRVAIGLERVLTTSAAVHHDRIAKLVTLGAAVAELPATARIDDHPFAACAVAQWSAMQAKSWDIALDGLEHAARDLDDLLGRAESKLGIASRVPASAVFEVGGLLSLLESGVPAAAPRVIARRDRGAVLERLEALVQAAAERAAARAELERTFHPKLFDLDLDALAAAFARHASSFVLVAWLGLRREKVLLATVARGPLPNSATIRARLEQGKRVRELERELAAAEPFLVETLGGAVDVAELERTVRFAKEWLASVGDLERIAPGALGAAALVGALEAAAAGGPNETRGAGVALLNADRQFEHAFDHVVRDLRPDPSRAFRGDGRDFTAHAVAERAAAWRAALPLLRGWTRYVAAEQAVRAADLGDLIAALRSGAVPRDRIVPAYERAFFEQWVDESVDAHRELRSFDGREHARVAAEFAAQDRRLIETTGRVVAREVAGARPRSVAAPAPESELGILRRESLKKRAHWPIRRLLERIPALVARLKPCFLMSPLSIAQYLPPSRERFDLVIFDEASQITTWDAVGAVARGRQVIVVGDSRQLPPTTFFTAEVDAEAGDETLEATEMVEDLDSILKECEAAGVPSLMLLWHYRSKDERLIAFSNRHYYDNRLHTFPAAVGTSERLGVRLVHVAGAFDRGGTRTNRAEAQAIVAWIVAALSDPARRSRSIGVVTFNLPQQTLIEDLLDDARTAHPEIEPFFGEGAPEPVFVKNLENVQGDERDVMLFSITYGPDAAGRTTMNFGPLNADGGERRLNVAVTRARELLVVFSTLTAAQIDEARARGVGVRHLKEFLRYAELGPSALAAASDAPSATRARRESPFEDDVARRLTERGIEFQREVGCSDYRIDFAVKDAAESGRSRLAIECDGANYWSGATARDRDRLRQEVLAKLGWTTHRIWSTDWHHDWKEEMDRVERALAEARGRPAAAWAGANAGVEVKAKVRATPE